MLCAVVTQLLHLHDLLHCRASMQGVLVVILACLDSVLWLDCLLSNSAALEAVFGVLVNESGFEEEVGAEEALQGQEAAWAVLAVVIRHVDIADSSMQVTCLSCTCRQCSTFGNCGAMCWGSVYWGGGGGESGYRKLLLLLCQSMCGQCQHSHASKLHLQTVLCLCSGSCVGQGKGRGRWTPVSSGPTTDWRQ